MSAIYAFWHSLPFNKGKISETTTNTGNQKFGTFIGAFVPCILMLFGVIIFLRLGWIVGQVGLITSLIIITLAALIALITCLSMAAISTNIEVGKGGVYYMLSRSLGIEAGSAVGLPIFLKQSLTIAFCVIGFAESLNDLIPSWHIKTIGIATLGALTFLAYTSVRGAMKVQMVIFISIIFSLISLFTGSGEITPMHPDTFTPSPLPSLGFWAVFALYFPAMTGVESSVSLSGDLRNPSRSLPLGTIGAIITAYIIYTTITLFLVYRVPMDRLVADPLIMQDIASIPSLIIVGIWGATLSSALGGLLGAPRTLQAMADDGIVPKIFGKTYGSMEEPRLATLVTCLIALFGVYFGSVNYLAPLLTMICLICYAVLNLSAGIETLMANPSWRPRFYVHWSISITGAVLCLVTMLMIDAGYALISLLIVTTIYFFVKKRKVETSWEDIRQGIFHYFSRLAVYQLAYSESSTKSWRPHFLVFTRSSEQRSTSLIKFSEAISQSKSFLTMVSFVGKGKETLYKRNQLSQTLTKNYKGKNIQAFVQVKEADSVTTGMNQMIENYGIGPLVPNTIIFGGIKKEDESTDFVNVLHTAIAKQCNVVIINDENHIQSINSKETPDIHVWWDDTHQSNSEFMLVIASMLLHNPSWKKARISLKAVVHNEMERQKKLAAFQSISVEKRLPLNTEVFVSNSESLNSLVQEFSKSASIVLLSLMPPKENESSLEYVNYLHEMAQMSTHLPSLALVLGSEHTPFNAILK